MRRVHILRWESALHLRECMRASSTGHGPVMIWGAGHYYSRDGRVNWTGGPVYSVCWKKHGILASTLFCNINFGNQKWVAQDKASIGWPGVFVHNAWASLAVALPIYLAGMAGHSGRTSSTLEFCRVNLCRGLKCATCLHMISYDYIIEQMWLTDIVW